MVPLPLIIRHLDKRNNCYLILPFALGEIFCKKKGESTESYSFQRLINLKRLSSAWGGANRFS